MKDKRRWDIDDTKSVIEILALLLMVAVVIIGKYRLWASDLPLWVKAFLG